MYLKTITIKGKKRKKRDTVNAAFNQLGYNKILLLRIFLSPQLYLCHSKIDLKGTVSKEDDFLVPRVSLNSKLTVYNKLCQDIFRCVLASL